MRRSYVIAAGIAMAVTGWILSGQVGGRQSPDTAPAAAAEPEAKLPQVRVRRLVAEERIGELVLFGRTEADRMVKVRAETAAPVAKLAVEKGGRVAKGDVIARLAMDDRRARLAEAEATVEQYRIAYQAALDLSKKSFRSRVSLAQAKAELEAAKAALERIRLDIEHTVIRAPFGGVVDDLPVEVGDYVKVADTVATLIDLDPIVVVGEVGERDVARIRTGGGARVRLATGERLVGAVRYISKMGSTATRTFRVEVAIDNPKGAVAEGVTAELRLPTERVSAHRLSPSVLTLSDEGVVGIKSVDADGRVAFHPVHMIADTPDGIWLGGLPDQITVITVGQEYVRTGQRVHPVPEEAGAEKGPV
ncbi:MAG: efflux RND transporter periplasmic adaptor subunit, partial [Rhodospirillales bacterium]|nr:efflux RND transporter periplasmic adaptor subunit [Rhodospirillales bacterium]